MLRTVMIAALFCLIFYSTPGYANSCAKARAAVLQFGEEYVVEAALAMGYTRPQITSFRRHCMRERMSRTRQARR